jgi:hypothetical protein
MRSGTLSRMLPVWLRRSRNRGGLSLMEASASFLILSIAAVGTLKTFALGRVGLEGEYEYKMAGELLRQRTEWMLGVVHAIPPTSDKWPAIFDQGNSRGIEVTIDNRGRGQTGQGFGNNRDVTGTIYYEAVKAVDDPETVNTNPDWYQVHTWIEWTGSQPTVWQRGAPEKPRGKRERIDFSARIVPVWIDSK